MDDQTNIYVSLDEARAELARRWQDGELRKRIEVELGENFIQTFGQESPRGVLTRQLCSPDNGFTFFFQCARYVNAEPLALEFTGDIFTHLNEEKKGLGRMHVTLADGSPATFDIMDFHANEKVRLSEAFLKSGENLVDFHHRLLQVAGLPVQLHDNTAWFRRIGKPSAYYYYLLSHFVVHGVLFETFSTDCRDGKETGFTKEVVGPALDRIEAQFGLKPLIVRLYPEEQIDDEVFYWWSYPPDINEYLLLYAKGNALSCKSYKVR